MHRGARQLFGKDNPEKASTCIELRKDVLVRHPNTVLIVILIKLGVLSPIESYFPGN